MCCLVAQSELRASEAVIQKAATQKVTSLSQYGITWTFENEVVVGQYISGDYWVQLPATIIAISPQQTAQPGRHGTEVNPVANREQGFDDRGNIGGGFTAERQVVLPYVLNNADVVMSSISGKELKKPSADALKENYCRGPVQTVALLTAVTDIPRADAFRPAYCGSWKQQLHVSDIQRDRLPQLKNPGEPADISRFRRAFDRPWIDHWSGWSARSLHPWENMPDYGREIADFLGMCSLLICTENFTEQHQDIFYNYMQIAIDLYGLTSSNKKLWHADGGHCLGRKAPILIAGHLFANEEMLAVDAVFHEDE
ncbi:MAG: hypothetical protein HRU15_14765, partial [Planctomycetes bacterium]|nr:hypothetical protein [Planctomycetota bacterium]